VEDLGLDIIWHKTCSIFTSELRKAHIPLMDYENELVWQFKNLGGKYSTNNGYHALISEGENNIEW
jgi:hypothetical protein